MKNKKGTKEGDRKPQTTPPIGGGFAVLLFDHFMVPLYFVQGPVTSNRKYRKIFVSFAVGLIRGIN